MAILFYSNKRSFRTAQITTRPGLSSFLQASLVRKIPHLIPPHLKLSYAPITDTTSIEGPQRMTSGDSRISELTIKYVERQKAIESSSVWTVNNVLMSDKTFAVLAVSTGVPVAGNNIRTLAAILRARIYAKNLASADSADEDGNHDEVELYILYDLILPAVTEGLRQFEMLIPKIACRLSPAPQNRRRPPTVAPLVLPPMIGIVDDYEDKALPTKRVKTTGSDACSSNSVDCSILCPISAMSATLFMSRDFMLSNKDKRYPNEPKVSPWDRPVKAILEERTLLITAVPVKKPERKRTRLSILGMLMGL